MNSRERVMTVFNGEIPDRVPAWCGATPEFWEKAKRELSLDDEQLFVRFGDDFRRVHAEYIGPELVPQDERAHKKTVFGIERQGIGGGQPLSHPLADAGLPEIHDYPWPDTDWFDVSKIKSQAGAWGGEYAILGGEWAPFWHDAIDLLGMENLYIKMYTEPEIVHAVFQHIMDFYLKLSRRTFESASGAVDIFFIGNDFGSQTGPLMSPEMFGEFMVPHLKSLADLGHSFGLKVQMHCCGGIAQLISQIIEAGIDALHAVQPTCVGMELDKLKAGFGDKIVFNGAIDSHHILIEGTPETVAKGTREVLDIMMPGGGYIAGASHDSILEETPVENILAMFDTIREYGSYPR